MNGIDRAADRGRQMVIVSVAALMLIGVVMIYSDTAVGCGLNPLENTFMVRQGAWMLVAVAAALITAHIDYHWLARRSRLLMLLTLLGLAALLVAGTNVNGARRWFRVGPMSLQVSEFAKIVIILYIASFVNRKHEVMGSFVHGFLPPLLMLGATLGLIVLEPDFGTATLIAAVVITMLVAGGVRWRHLAPLLLAGLPLMFLLLRLKEYRWRRLLVFADPWVDPQGAGYHVVQSLIALGCGGLTGLGPGRGLQKLGFLPEAETDFIFAIYGQETGFIGCVLLLLAFVALFYGGIRICRAAPDALGGLIALGVTVLIGYQMLINVAVAASAMPTKGISLPFVSFGGSSLVALSAGIGMLVNVSKHCAPSSVARARGATRKGDAA